MDTRAPRSMEMPSQSERLSDQWGRVSPRLRLMGGIVAAIVVVLLAWRFIMSGAAPPPKMPPPPVRVATAWTQNVTVQERTIGTIVANSTVQITSRVEGQLVTAPFKEGDIVHKGDLLFQLDPRPFQAALAETVATQARDQASLVSARNDAARYAALAQQGAASKSQADQFVAQAKALTATVAADKANVDAARLNLIYASIHSPIDGKTGPILIQPGNVVPANGTSPLVVITQIQPVKVSFFLPQSDLPRIQDQMIDHRLFVTIAAHDAMNTQLRAPIDFVGNAVDNTTGTVELRATFVNQDYRLVPGQSLDVSVSLANLANALVVPREAVNQGPQGRYVFIVTKDGNAEMQAVSVLYDDGTNAAIQGNVRRGDRVITDGQLRVVARGPVTIVKGRAGVAQQASGDASP